MKEKEKSKMKRTNLHWKKATAIGASLLVWSMTHGSTAADPNTDLTEDWPQWRGPNRDGVSQTARLDKKWPDNGPKEVWRQPLGEGFSGISIADSRVYTMYSTGASEFVVSLNALDGSEVWKSRTGAKYSEGNGNGPRCTPTVDGDRVYTLGASGELLALEVGMGKTIWQRNLRREFRSKRPHWGFTSSPLIEGNSVLVEAGGSNERALMAFDKMTGEELWGSGGDPIGYSSPIAVDALGVRQILFFTGAALVSLSPDGQPYWRHTWPNEGGINPATPVFIPPDRVFVSSGYGTGGAVLQMQSTDAGPGVSEVWFSKEMKNHFSTSIYHEGHIYGFDEAIFKCVDVDTGDERWKVRGYGKGTLIFADGHLIVLSDEGKLAMVEANPDAHVEVTSAQVMNDRCWTSPSLAAGRLYLRNMVEIVCLDLAGRT